MSDPGKTWNSAGQSEVGRFMRLLFFYQKLSSQTKTTSKKIKSISGIYDDINFKALEGGERDI